MYNVSIGYSMLFASVTVSLSFLRTVRAKSGVCLPLNRPEGPGIMHPRMANDRRPTTLIVSPFSRCISNIFPASPSRLYPSRPYTVSRTPRRYVATGCPSYIGRGETGETMRRRNNKVTSRGGEEGGSRGNPSRINIPGWQAIAIEITSYQSGNNRRLGP